MYYYGEGILVAYLAFRFIIVENSRIEYGEDGEYAVCVYHFADVDMLKTHFRIKEIEMENSSKLREYRVDDDISYEYTFSDIQKVVKERKNMKYRTGETRVMVNGKIQIQNLFIMYEGYTLFFLGCSEKKDYRVFNTLYRNK